MSVTDNDSQDSLSMDGTFLLVKTDPKIETSDVYHNLMEEVLQESQDRVKTPTRDVDKIKTENVAKRIGCYLFRNVYFLGTCIIEKLNDGEEANRCIEGFSKQNIVNCKVSLTIPFVNNGSVKMYEGDTENLLGEYPVCHIGFCTSAYKSLQGEYFAFSYLQKENVLKTHNTESPKDCSVVTQCHVFKLKSPFYTNRLLECFRKAFEGRSNDFVLQPNTVRSYSKTINVQFKLTLDIKEDDGKGNFTSVPKEDNQIFKFRSNVKKKIIIKMEQRDGPLNLCIERCMGLFVGAGRYLSDVDMTLLEMDSLGEITDKSDGFIISGEWNPCDKGFELLNCTRDKDQQVYMTIGISFCIQEIDAPLCLKLACKAKIYNEFQRFWLTLKKSTVIHLMLSLEEMSDCNSNEVMIGKYAIKTIQYIWPDNVITVSGTTDYTDANNQEFVDSDNDEPMKSGDGMVSKDITNEKLMVRWNSLLKLWKSDPQSRPKELNELMQIGIPESLRGEVWQLLASSVNRDIELQEVYKILITKETKFDSVIKRDMPRTFTAHPMFMEKDGTGQETLFRVCKSYALYDEEIGYSQSSAFLAAALLIHMPEEQTFTLLVCIMNNYRVRDLYRNNFEGLHICLYQLDNLIMEKLNDLCMHFSELQLESHMYANQWFLTLFTMKFPLCAVFHILDLFLTDGMVIIFKVALALLKLSKKDLLTMDFEGALNYFRITLPKLYRNEDSCQELIDTALNIKISNKKLLRLEKEWKKIQEVRAETEDPLEIFQKELKKVKEEYNRLDQENDSLAKELVSSKISLQKTVDKLDENLEIVNNELFTTRKDFVEAVEEKEHLLSELTMVKDKFREEVQAREGKLKEHASVISDYKKMATELSDRTEKAESRSAVETDGQVAEHLKSIIETCETCKSVAMDSSLLETETNDGASGIVCMTRAEYRRQRDQIQETELLLANTKLSLVESQCAHQQLYNEVTGLRELVADQQQSLAASKMSIMKKFWPQKERSQESKTSDLLSRLSLRQPELPDRLDKSLRTQSLSQSFL